MIPVLKSRPNSILSAIQVKYPNYHPLIAIAEIAHTEGVDIELKFNCHKTIAKYIEPELKAVEIKTDPNNLPTVRVSLFQDDISDAEIITEPAQIENW